MADIADAVDGFGAAFGRVGGVLRINAPHVALPMAVTPLVAAMSRRHPGRGSRSDLGRRAGRHRGRRLRRWRAARSHGGAGHGGRAAHATLQGDHGGLAGLHGRRPTWRRPARRATSARSPGTTASVPLRDIGRQLCVGLDRPQGPCVRRSEGHGARHQRALRQGPRAGRHRHRLHLRAAGARRAGRWAAAAGPAAIGVRGTGAVSLLFRGGPRRRRSCAPSSISRKRCRGLRWPVPARVPANDRILAECTARGCRPAGGRARRHRGPSWPPASRARMRRVAQAARSGDTGSRWRRDERASHLKASTTSTPGAGDPARRGWRGPARSPGGALSDEVRRRCRSRARWPALVIDRPRRISS